MRIFYLLYFILFIPSFLVAQKKVTPIIPMGTTFFRINPLGLADPVDGNLNAGIEYRLQQQWSLAADAAWIFRSNYLQHSEHSNGGMLRGAVRLYTGKYFSDFFELELHYKQVQQQIHDWVGKALVNNVPSYEEYTALKIQRQSYGFHLKAGEQYCLTRNQKLWLDASAGFGLRVIQIGIKNREGISYTPEGPFTNGRSITNHQHWILPAFPITFRLLYKVSY